MAKWKYQPSVKINSLMLYQGAFQIHSRRTVLAIKVEEAVAPCSLQNG